MDRFEVAIIGAGMSGLAAGIRLAHFGKRVCIFERHNAPGGLNSFYSKAGRKYDVGLHAMTNYVRPGVKGTPLNRILRQLRLSREDLNLSEQKRSRVAFSGENLIFDNDFRTLETEVARAFPQQIDSFRQLVEDIKGFDDSHFDYTYQSAREAVQRRISDPLLEDMIFCPLMYYGSSTEDDMDFGQFVIMFKSIFLEGFARPLEGIRGLIRLLLQRYRENGGIRQMKTGVKEIAHKDGKVQRLILDDDTEVEADVVLSSAGLAETYRLCGDPIAQQAAPLVGQLSFTETITSFPCPPSDFGWGEDTIVFFCAEDRFSYRDPEDPVDLNSGVICLPNNFDYGNESLPEGVVRVTNLAHFPAWKGYRADQYYRQKDIWRDRIWESAARFMPATTIDSRRDATAFDMFTPTTVERYTWRERGAIYGSPSKAKSGETPLENLFICGADQGFLGIVGSMISGIAIANTHVLSK